MKVPGFLLRRLYVRGSLIATETGFSFQLRNHLGSGFAHELHPLTLDGNELEMALTTFEVDNQTTTFATVSNLTPFTLAMNKTTTIEYHGGQISPGSHVIGMSFSVAGLGDMAFDFTDQTGRNL